MFNQRKFVIGVSLACCVWFGGVERVRAEGRSQVIQAFEQQRRAMEEQIACARRDLVCQADHERRQVISARTELLRQRPPYWRERLADLNARQREIDVCLSTALRQLEWNARSQRQQWREAREEAIRLTGRQVYRPWWNHKR